MKKKTIEFTLENCEAFQYVIDSSVFFDIEESVQSYSLSQERGKMMKHEHFTKAYVIIGKDATLSEQFSFGKESPFERLTKYNDITGITVCNETFFPLFKGDQDNANQKSYITKEGHLVIDWGDCLLNTEDEYLKDGSLEGILKHVDCMLEDY